MGGFGLLSVETAIKDKARFWQQSSWPTLETDRAGRQWPWEFPDAQGLCTYLYPSIPVTALFSCPGATGGFICVHVGRRCDCVEHALLSTPSLVCVLPGHIRGSETPATPPCRRKATF